MDLTEVNILIVKQNKLLENFSVEATDRRRLDLRNEPNELADVLVSAGVTCTGKSYARCHDSNMKQYCQQSQILNYTNFIKFILLPSRHEKDHMLFSLNHYISTNKHLLSAMQTFTSQLKVIRSVALQLGSAHNYWPKI
jgi:hypothetical protein